MDKNYTGIENNYLTETTESGSEIAALITVIENAPRAKASIRKIENQIELRKTSSDNKMIMHGADYHTFLFS